MKLPDPKKEVEALLIQAEQTIPREDTLNLPPIQGYPHVPQWHPFELELWKIGEQIRQVINSATVLRKDHDLYSRFFKIASDQRGKRGRQSFILLFWYKPCAPWAEKMAGLLGDTDIDGHIISALYKMKARGFSSRVEPYIAVKTTWIRNEAKRYIRFDKSTEAGA